MPCYGTGALLATGQGQSIDWYTYSTYTYGRASSAPRGRARYLSLLNKVAIHCPRGPKQASKRGDLSANKQSAQARHARADATNVRTYTDTRIYLSGRISIPVGFGIGAAHGVWGVLPPRR